VLNNVRKKKKKPLINYNAAGAGAREVPATPPAGSGGRRISTQVSLYVLIRIVISL
jgi:hypothetical protein